jgi:hypothetical protein
VVAREMKCLAERSINVLESLSSMENTCELKKKESKKTDNSNDQGNMREAEGCGGEVDRGKSVHEGANEKGLKKRRMQRSIRLFLKWKCVVFEVHRGTSHESKNEGKGEQISQGLVREPHRSPFRGKFV